MSVIKSNKSTPCQSLTHKSLISGENREANVNEPQTLSLYKVRGERNICPPLKKKHPHRLL